MSSVARVTSSASARPGGVAPAVEAEPTDRMLLDRCLEGDEQAWDRLVGRYQRLVFSVALKNGASREDAADITQLTFVALLDSISTVRGDRSVAAWLTTVARRHAWRMRRRRAREQPWPTESFEAPATDEDHERIAAVHAGLARLGPQCRALLYALFFDPDAPAYAVIADRLQLAVGTIGPQRARCLQRLRVLLDDDEETAA